MVDLSADFRLRDPATYAAWYKREHVCTDLLHKAVYGLPELYGADIARTSLVAIPAATPRPQFWDSMLRSKTTSSTATTWWWTPNPEPRRGRKAAVPTLFPKFRTTSVPTACPPTGHTPEIEQEISLLAGQDVRLSFNTHLLPTNRGILATIYTRLKDPRMDLDAVRAVYTETWSHSPWVRILPKGALPETRYVRGSMFCDLGLVVDPRTRTADHSFGH